jgi:predicted metal-dependent phosphotriesterase family hydrolase
MSKEQTPIEIIKVMIENGVEITVDHVTKLLTKEKEQREELIKEAYKDGMTRGLKEARRIMDGYPSWENAEQIEQEAEQYYNEVFKNYPKQ